MPTSQQLIEKHHSGSVEKRCHSYGTQISIDGSIKYTDECEEVWERIMADEENKS